MRRVRLWWWTCLLAVLVLATCNARPTVTPSPTLVLGPLVQMGADGRLRLVWWTNVPGEAAVALLSHTPQEVPATGQEWQKTDASPPLDRAWRYVAVLPDLPADTRLPYRLLLNGQALGPPTPFRLRVPPRRPPVRLAIIGDYGAGTPWAEAVRDLVRQQQPDLILTAGDNAYNRGRYDEFRTRVFNLYGDLMAQVPFMPAIGNHDNATAHAQPYLDFFELPRQALRPQEAERYYSFDVANVHVIVLDTTDALDGVSDLALDDMADWLAEDLARTRQPWRIAVFHHPPYSAGAHGSDRRVRRWLVPLLEAGGVQWVFNGHEHDYQRTCPLREDRCVSAKEGVTYVITGGGGAWLRPTGSEWFTARSLSVHEAAFLTVESCRTVLRVYDVAGNLIDRAEKTLPDCGATRLPWLMRHFPVWP